MSPRRFNRRTYMIAASGRSALTFKAAMSASSATTTIRSTLPFALTPMVNCQDIFERSHKAERARPQLAPSSHRYGLFPIRRAHRPQTHRFQLQWLGVLKLQDPEPDLGRSTLRRSGYRQRLEVRVRYPLDGSRIFLSLCRPSCLPHTVVFHPQSSSIRDTGEH